MSTQVPEIISERPQPPIALATLKTGQQGHYWIVRRCPHCGKRHVHGGGRLGSDPRTFLGHRNSHCINRSPLSSAGYVLVESASKVQR